MPKINEAIDAQTRIKLLDQQFYIQNNSARRQLTSPINAPALTWHHGFWKPEKEDADDWRRKVDITMHTIFEILVAEFGCVRSENVDGNQLNLFSHWVGLKDRSTDEENSANRSIADALAGCPNPVYTKFGKFVRNTIKYEVPFDSSTFIVIAEMSKEFWTLTYVLEVVPDYYKYDSRLKETPQLVSEVLEMLCETIGKLRAPCGTPEQHEENFRGWSEGSAGPMATLKKFRAMLDASINTGVVSKLFEDRTKPPPWGGKFLDFQGILMPCVQESAETSCEKTHHCRTRLRRVERVLRHRLSGCDSRAEAQKDTQWSFGVEWRKIDQSPKDTVAPFRRPTRQGWLNIVSRLWPAVDSMREGAAPTEVTVSTFQSGRSLYVSSLGRRYTSEVVDSRPASEARRARSVKFIVVVAHHNKWELGRLIDRLHKAGTMRVAAMRDIAGIEGAGDYLSKLRSSIWNDFGSLMENGFHGNRGEELRERVVARQNELRNIHESSGPDGLEFRVSQSQYYIQQFKVHAEALRIGRVTGFQRYDVFVQRRLSSAFETVTMVFVQFKEARDELDALLQRVQSELSVELTRNAEAFIAVGSVYYLGIVCASVVGGALGLAKDIKDQYAVPAAFVPLLFLFTASLLWKRIQQWRSRKRLKHELSKAKNEAVSRPQA